MIEGAWPPVAARQRIIDHRSLEGAIRASSSREVSVLEVALYRYLVVRSAGLVEAIRDDVADRYAQRFGITRLHRRITHHLRTGVGCTPKQLIGFVETFDPTWADELSDFLARDDDDLRMRLGALVAARKKVAHGDGEQITSGRALGWSACALEISEWLVQRFNPARS